MSQLSQIDATATYDAKRGVLEITGTTQSTRHHEPQIVAIHAALKQEGRDTRNGHTTVPEICLRLPEWMAQFEGEYELGSATVYGLAIAYEPKNSSLHSQVWAQTIEIKAGRVYPLSAWDPAERRSSREEVAV